MKLFRNYFSDQQINGGRYSRLLAVAVLTFWVAACTTVQTGQQGDGADSAQRMSAQGDHVAASREYLDLAMGADGNQRQRYLIFAAGELYQANDLTGAERILQEVGPIADANLEVWAEVTAQVLLAREQPQAALDALNRVTATNNKESAVRILLLRAQALFRLQRAEAAVATMLKRENLLSSRSEQENNQRMIWTGLQTAAESIPQNPAAANGDPVLTGWLQLGRISYDNRTSLSDLTRNLELWQRQNPQHPASGAFLDDMLASLNAMADYPERVAVLLPLSGRQQGLGEAIRDGYLAAHYALGENAARPEIRIYDTARNGAVAAYQQAMLNGTDFIVGPLLKNEITEIAELAGEVNVLALNYAQDDPNTPAGFFQFALSPEDEARAAADRATDEGLFNAVALVPESDWGQRVFEAFRDQLEKHGGKVLAAQAYPANTPDFSQAIRGVLLLDESYSRRDRLAANIGKPLEFEPRRRQDVDLVFLGATGSAAKLLKPQLRFHYAGDLPTYATSAVYQPGTTDNADLNGIIFPDIPWLLTPNQMAEASQAVLQQYWGPVAIRRSRFYAMGYDAYHLTAVLNGRSGGTRVKINGVTGLLSVDRDGQLHRQLKWARMERGRPRVLPEMPSGLTQDAEIVLSQQ
jgi:outer membrane PBP1 activator LpoA protein